jgi:hypothetical protein
VESDDPVPIYYVNDPTKAELIRNALHEEGIACAVAGEQQGGFAGVLEIQILTKAADAERALAIIREAESHMAQSDAETEAEPDAPGE